MDYDEIESLRRRSPAWRLLRADNAPLLLGFLGRVFVEENVRSLPGSELASRLDDELFVLNEQLGPSAYPKAAKAYLDDWAAPEAGWLRKYYPEGSNEPYFDATVAVEKALSWIALIRERSFVGTESRLNIVFELRRPGRAPARLLARSARTTPLVRLVGGAVAGHSQSSVAVRQSPSYATQALPGMSDKLSDNHRVRARTRPVADST